VDGGESEDDWGIYCVNAFMGGDDSGLEEELEYYPYITPNEKEDEKTEEDRCWSPDLSWLQLEEEKRDTEEGRTLASPS
jgi:hypothetical protein